MSSINFGAFCRKLWAFTWLSGLFLPPFLRILLRLFQIVFRKMALKLANALWSNLKVKCKMLPCRGPFILRNGLSSEDGLFFLTIWKNWRNTFLKFMRKWNLEMIRWKIYICVQFVEKNLLKLKNWQNTFLKFMEFIMNWMVKIFQ